jgi:hypothetical protein
VSSAAVLFVGGISQFSFSGQTEGIALKVRQTTLSGKTLIIQMVGVTVPETTGLRTVIFDEQSD